MFYLAIIQNDTTNGLYTYNSLEDVLAAYHQELSYRAEGRTSTKCAILDNDLHMLRQETYVAPTAEPNVEPEAEEG